ncbi:MAG: homoserine O-acetyltransferase MetX [Ktedonobacterales bacterium]
MAGGLTMTNQIEEVPMSLDKPEALRTPRLERATQSGIRGSGLRSVTLDALSLDDGNVLAPVTIAYESWGHLSPQADNAILLCHALTGSAHARDDEAPDDPRAGWWNPLIGPGRALDTDRYFVICSNVLGGCYGTTGPISLHPADGQPYRLRFPLVSIGDMVRAQHALLQHLGIRRLAAVAGGSVGGLQALEWAIAYPEAVERAIVVAAGPRLSAQGLAIDDIARQAILTDSGWHGGNYPIGEGPRAGLGIARMLAMLTYTSPEGLDVSFGRQRAARPSGWPAFGPRFDVETYLHHQADKLIERFDATTYLYLSSAMDRYDAAEGLGRGSDAATYSRIRANVLAIGISTDWLYPADQVRALAEGINATGGKARYVELDSLHGHDAFLKEWHQMDAALRPFLATNAESDETDAPAAG